MNSVAVNFGKAGLIKDPEIVTFGNPVDTKKSEVTEKSTQTRNPGMIVISAMDIKEKQESEGFEGRGKKQ